MKITFDNQVMSSMLVWLDYVLIRRGEAYANHSGYFYPTDSRYNGYFAYSAPFKPFVYDTSVSGPTVPTGLYLNNIFISTGTSGFAALDYRNGRAYFTSKLPQNSTLSGNYAVKEYSVELTDKAETELLFETKMSLRPKITQTPTGLQSDQLTYPVIFLRKKSSYNEPHALGGQDDTKINVTAIVFSDSQFSLDGVLGMMRDTNETYIPLLNPPELPLNALGDYKNGVLNYTGLTNNRVGVGSGIRVEQAQEVQFDRAGQFEMKQINPDVYFGMVDFTLSFLRYPRQ
jgi:hypothetical protein